MAASNRGCRTQGNDSMRPAHSGHATTPVATAAPTCHNPQWPQGGAFGVHPARLGRPTRPHSFIHNHTRGLTP